MPGTYDTDTIASVRLLIPDAEAIYGEAGNENIFQDADICLFLDTAGGNVMVAGGLAKIAVGGSEALIAKVIKNYETTTDGAKLQMSWIAAGKELIAVGIQQAALLSGDFFIIAYPDDGYDAEGETNGGFREPVPYGVYPSPTGYNF